MSDNKINYEINAAGVISKRWPWWTWADVWIQWRSITCRHLSKGCPGQRELQVQRPWGRSGRCVRGAAWGQHSWSRWGERKSIRDEVWGSWEANHTGWDAKWSQLLLWEVKPLKSFSKGEIQADLQKDESGCCVEDRPQESRGNVLRPLHLPYLLVLNNSLLLPALRIYWKNSGHRALQRRWAGQ